MSTIFGDENKLFHSPTKNHSFLDIPPRKLFLTKKSLDMSSLESNLLKFLPCNDSGKTSQSFSGLEADSDLDPYSSDHFRMYEFKIRRCTRSRSHDWTDCPFAHPGEKARRRDPRKYHYSGTVCPEFRRGDCSRGDGCEFAHGVFECWLHPSRYRTEACKDGRNCKRKVCFFAHTPRQLRLLPEISPAKGLTASASGSSSAQCNHGHCCCLGCHSMISSPTSTLLAANTYSPPMSPSPPLSPVSHSGSGGFSRHVDRLSKLGSGVFSYKDVLNELMNSLEAVNFSDGASALASPITTAGRNYFSDEAVASSSPISASVGRSYFNDGSAVSSPNSATKFNANPWIDCNSCFNGDDHQQNPINLSPNYNSTPKPYVNGEKGDSLVEFGKEISGEEEIKNGSGLASFGPPDLGWVNELLM